jgi:hypothetical protein
MTPDEIAAFLTRPLNAVLTTLGSDGFPHPTAMWFAYDSDGISMWTYAKSQKAVNLRRDPRCAFLAEDGTRYDELRGVMIRDRARLVEDFDAIRDIGIRLYHLYTEPATGIDVMDGPIVEIERQARKRIGIRLGLENVASWDHSRL